MGSLKSALFALRRETKIVVSKNEQEALIVTLSDGTDAARKIVVVQSISEERRPYYEHMYGGLEGGGNWQRRHPIFGPYQGALGPGWLGRTARRTVYALLYALGAMSIALWLVRWLG